MTITVKALVFGSAILAAAAARPARTQIEIGTWVRKVSEARPELTMTIEACCNGGRKLTYHVKTGAADALVVVETHLDGADAPVVVAGQKSPQTMAIKRDDDHHATTVLKLNGAVIGTSKTTLSPDGKTMTNQLEYTNAAAGLPPGKYTEVWVRQ